MNTGAGCRRGGCRAPAPTGSLSLLSLRKVCRLMRCGRETSALIDGVKGRRCHLRAPLSLRRKEFRLELVLILLSSPCPAESLRVWGLWPFWLGIKWGPGRVINEPPSETSRSIQPCTDGSPGWGQETLLAAQAWLHLEPA